VDELHAAIAAYLRHHRRAAEVQRPQADAARHGTDAARVRQLFRHAPGRYPAPRCLICGRAVDDAGGLFSLGELQVRRLCVEHYTPF